MKNYFFICIALVLISFIAINQTTAQEPPPIDQEVGDSGDEGGGVTIVCDQDWRGKTEAWCWKQRVTIPGRPPCEWTGLRTVCNTFIGW
ncbi:MAG: hypothetical protein CVU12_03270 [Bacteroidetes bacterium HGW-Bacteroidetes-7]|jgi:hypothetical protein|nr:MAG: hypothetical protein CVU12_03270 [Bacteroidetes bacterium HGW-Bacteroidetes-7]